MANVVYGVFKRVDQSAYTEPRYFSVAEDSNELLDLYESKADAEAECRRLNQELTAMKAATPDDEEEYPVLYYHTAAFTVKKAKQHACA